MAANGSKAITVSSLEKRTSTPSLRSPRQARFAEATSIVSPIEPSDKGRNPFLDPPTNHYMPQPQPSDVGFGYLTTTEVEVEETDRNYLPPQTPKSPLKSALKSPGGPPREFYNLRSPTFREEQVLEKQEEFTEKEQAKDLKVKTRVRMAKMVLRGVSFGCSLIVLAMLATVFSIFNATKHLPPRSNLPPWAANSKTWPQIVLLVIACISLVMAVVVLAAYFRGGHKRAEKVAVYYTTFAVGFFIFSIIMWAIGAGVLNQSKANGNGQDLWGWSCKENKRRTLFENEVNYALICRLQDWSLVCCIIEVVVEVFCIIIYGIVFYRYWSKRKLRKSMAVRDRARSDLYLAQLKSQSAPNTPGFGPMSPRSGGWRPPPGHPMYVDPLSAAENGESDSVQQYPRGVAQPKPFQLQAPPIRIQGATPKLNQDGFESTSPQTPVSPSFADRQNEHVPAAPGEQQYASVPIPGAYASPASPGFAPPTSTSMQAFDFGEDVKPTR